MELVSGLIKMEVNLEKIILEREQLHKSSKITNMNNYFVPSEMLREFYINFQPNCSYSVESIMIELSDLHVEKNSVKAAGKNWKDL